VTLPWRLAQAAALLGLLGAAVALVAAPSLGLRVVWSAAVPVLPAVFLLGPALWRNVCPLATLGTGGAPATPLTTSEWRARLMATSALPVVGPAAPAPTAGARSLPTVHASAGQRARRTVIARANVTGIVLLLALLPARRLLLNESAPATLALVAAAGLAAWTLGRRGERKAGFCNALCPILPVERLYGQAPLVAAGNPRCEPCTVCTTRGCLDLAGRKAVAQVLGPGRRSRAWLREPFGAFAASFPGLVLAYGLAPALAGSPAGTVALFLALGAVSWLVVLAAAVRGAPSTVLVPGCAAVAAALYYWFAGPDLGRAWGLPALGEAVRVAGLGVVGLWVVARR
jgi:hypothetical protein